MRDLRFYGRDLGSSLVKWGSEGAGRPWQVCKVLNGSIRTVITIEGNSSKSGKEQISSTHKINFQGH